MRNKSSLLGGVALGVLLAASLSVGAQAKTKKHHHVAAAPAASDARLGALADEVEALKARLDAETVAREQTEAQVQAAQSQAAAAQADAQAARSQLAEQIQTIPGEVGAAVAANKPKTDKVYYKGVTVTLGGFAAAETASRSHDQTADIGSSFAKLPFANDAASHTAETAFTARQSRYSALVEGAITPAIHGSFYGEFDFLGAAQTANSNESNSYTPRVRNLYGAIDWNDSGWHLLAGQSWSLATMNNKGITQRNESIPSTIDAQYVPGFVWARQPQIRLTKDFNKQLWLAVSLENPQTTFSGVKTTTGTLVDGQAPTSQYFAGVTGVSSTTTLSGSTYTTTDTLTNNPYSLNAVPDVIAKVAFEESFYGHNLHAEAFGIYRSFQDRVTITPGTLTATGNTLQSNGGGVGGGFLFGAVPGVLDVQGSILSGQGIGRYGSGQLPDTTSKPNGQLVGIPETLWLAGATLHATPQLDVYAYAGGEQEASSEDRVGSSLYGYGNAIVGSNVGCSEEGGSCSALTKSIGQATVGLWDKFYQGPFGRFQFGLQYSYTERKAFADATTAGNAPKTNENMIFTSFRYYPF